MKKILTILSIPLLLIVILVSCRKEAREENKTEGISQTVLDKIARQGFSTENVREQEDGYIVEGDIIISREDLDAVPNIQLLRVGDEEQYRTTNLVTGLPKVLTVKFNSNWTPSSKMSQALNTAITRYNALGLRLSFQRVASTSSAQITLSRVSGTGGSSGFPSGGQPYHTVNIGSGLESFSVGVVAHVMEHEIGHCIGFRHTDYMNRSYSCGTGGSEGTAGVGAIHIPGTPTGPSAGSWMLACFTTTSTGIFTSSDQTALQYVY